MVLAFPTRGVAQMSPELALSAFRSAVSAQLVYARRYGMAELTQSRVDVFPALSADVDVAFVPEPIQPGDPDQHDVMSWHYDLGARGGLPIRHAVPDLAAVVVATISRAYAGCSRGTASIAFAASEKALIASVRTARGALSQFKMPLVVTVH